MIIYYPESGGAVISRMPEMLATPLPPRMIRDVYQFILLTFVAYSAERDIYYRKNNDGLYTENAGNTVLVAACRVRWLILRIGHSLSVGNNFRVE